MSFKLTDAAIEQFDAEVKHQYQGKMTLRDLVTTRMGVTGKSYQFASMSRGAAVAWTGPAAATTVPSDLTPMGITHDRQTATLMDFYAAEYTTLFDQAEVNYSEKMELAQTIAKAIGRREDQIIIDAMRAVTFDATPSAGEGKLIASAATTSADSVVGDTDFSIDLMFEAREYFQSLEVDPEDQYFAITAHAMNRLLKDNKIASYDYNTSRVLVNGDVKSFMGFKLYVIGTRAENGLAKRGDFWTGYAWHKPAVGYASSLDRKTSVDWIPEKLSWLCAGVLKAGAVARDPAGIVEFKYKEL